MLDDQGLNPDRGWKFSSLPSCPGCLWGPPSLLFSGYWGGYFPGGQAAET